MNRTCECGCGETPKCAGSRFLRGHEHKVGIGTNALPLRDRLLSRLIIDWNTGCWNWSGPLSKGGYGTISIRRDGEQRTRTVHRVTYEMILGPIPQGLELDHLCRNRKCANPAHLEPVTRRENLRRGEGFTGRRARQTHCIRGHEFDEANTYVRKENGTRHCKTCANLRRRVAA